jgi:hypothetical protein
MKLHADLKQRLVALTTEALASVQVEKAMFLSYDTDTLFASGDVALPADVAHNAHDIVSDHPFRDFVVGFLSDKLRVAFSYKDVETRPLIGVAGFENAATLAADVVESFASLPWRYDFVFPLPLNAAPLSAQDREYPIADNLRLVRAGEAFSASHPAPAVGYTLRSLMLSQLGSTEPSPARSWPTDTLNLVYTAMGI